MDRNHFTAKTSEPEKPSKPETPSKPTLTHTETTACPIHDYRSTTVYDELSPSRAYIRTTNFGDGSRLITERIPRHHCEDLITSVYENTTGTRVTTVTDKSPKRFTTTTNYETKYDYSPRREFTTRVRRTEEYSPKRFTTTHYDTEYDYSPRREYTSRVRRTEEYSPRKSY